MNNLPESARRLAQFLVGKNEDEIENLLKDASRLEENTYNRRISEKEYLEILKERLNAENLKWFLEITRCKHLYMLLYPDSKGAKWMEFIDKDDELEGSEGTSSDGDSDFGFYMDDLLRILTTLNRTNKNPARLKFFNFLDLCWEAVGFDLWGKGTHDKVFDSDCVETYSETNQLKPSDVRKTWLGYIKDFLIKWKTNAEIGEEHVQKLGDSFKSKINFY